MSKREAIRILMLSPIYFKLSLTERHELIAEFLQIHMQSSSKMSRGKK
jgi:hypothetical protein